MGIILIDVLQKYEGKKRHQENKRVQSLQVIYN